MSIVELPIATSTSVDQSAGCSCAQLTMPQRHKVEPQYLDISRSDILDSQVLHSTLRPRVLRSIHSNGLCHHCLLFSCHCCLHDYLQQLHKYHSIVLRYHYLPDSCHHPIAGTFIMPIPVPHSQAMTTIQMVT